jgi:hypothetical protein
MDAAHDAEKAAKVAAARARHKTFQGEPLPPKRMPKNAVLLSSLPADEQRRIDAEIERQMAPIREADAACNAAAERLAAAIRAARAALAPRSEGVDRGSRTLHDVPEREAVPEVPVTGWSVEAENVRAAAPVPSVLERRCGEDHQRPDRDDLGDVRNDAEPVLPGHADHHRAAEEDVA